MSKKISIRISGMTCTLCSYKIESKLQKIDGIKEVIVNFSTEVGTILFDENLCSVDKIYNIINSLGFCVDDEKGTESKKYLKKLKAKVIISLLLVSPLILAMLICWIDDLCILIDPNYSNLVSKLIGSIRYKIYFIHNWKIQLALVFPVQFIIGYEFYKNALYSIVSRMVGMDLLVAIGTGSTFGYSLYTAIKQPNFDGRELYFEAGAMIIAFVLLGKYLEALAKKRTTKSIDELAKVQPKSAKVVTDYGEIEKEIENIKIGEVIAIHPGERIPLDGVIVEGNTTVDEAMITGESNWVVKKVGDQVIGGTINTLGSILFKVEKIGNNTVLASIIHLVEAAQSSKPKIQKLADKICRIFVPSILFAATLTFCFWYFYVYHGSNYYIEKPILYAVAVLVVSCPCALGLATPTAICIGTGVGAENGILFRNGQALQDACKINTIVFDKTGTLTVGSPVVEKIIKLNKNSKYSEKQLLNIAASIEKNSEHPLGKAIYQKALNTKASLKDARDFIAEAGKGVRGNLDGHEVLIGTENYLIENNIKVEKNEENKFIKIYIAIDNINEGIITLNDAIKSNVKETIDILKKKGIEVVMITGDLKSTAENIGKEVGIDKIYSQVLPKDKAKIIKELKYEKRFVAMVGDGINDAPALANADISFAIGAGTDVAIQSSDIIILGKDLSQIPVCIDLSKKTINKIKENLFLSLIYNGIAIPFAAFGKLSPELASACMALSSLSVVINSLSLKKVKVKQKVK